VNLRSSDLRATAKNAYVEWYTDVKNNVKNVPILLHPVVFFYSFGWYFYSGAAQYHMYVTNYVSFHENQCYLFEINKWCDW
jgi:hypothetical protein